MITTTLKQVLTDSGCDLVLYEQDKLANLYTDQSHQDDVVGLILQPNTVTLEVKANAVHEHFPPVYVEVLQQVRLEDNADNNEAKLQALLDICKEIVVRLIGLQMFRKVQPMTLTKILENRYDLRRACRQQRQWEQLNHYVLHKLPLMCLKLLRL